MIDDGNLGPGWQELRSVRNAGNPTGISLAQKVLLHLPVCAMASRYYHFLPIDYPIP